MEPTIDTELPSDETVDPIVETEVSEEPSEEDELVVDGSSLNSMEVAEDVKVSVSQVILDDKNKPASYGDLTDAAITFTQNTVDDDGTVNKDAKNILFKVTPVSGKKLSKLQYALGDTEEDFAFDKKPTLKNISVNADENAEYKVADAVKDLASKKKLVRIYVTMESVSYTVSFDKTAAGGATVHLKKADESGDYDFDTDKSGGSVKVTYGDSLTFAVKNLENAKLTAKKADADDDTAITLAGEEQTVEGSDPAETFMEYTLTPTEVAGLSSTKDEAVKVILGVDSKPVVTLAADNLKTEPSAASITIESVEADEDSKSLAAGVYAAGDKIAFAVAVGSEDYKLSERKAYWMPSGEEDTEANSAKRHSLDISEETFGETAGYAIDLADVTEAADLYVSISAELDDEKDAVKTVSFAGDGHAKAVAKDGDLDDEKANIIGKSQKTTGDSYEFDVQADDGYAVTKIEAEISKKYDDETTGSETIVIKANGTKDDADSDLYPFNDKKTITIPFSGTDVAEEEGAEDKGWTTREVKITITTGVQTSVLDSNVTVLSRGNYADKSLGAYTVVVKEEEDKVEKNGNSYTVKAGAEYLEFAVTDAESEPVVKVHGDTALAEKVDGEGFTYRVPAVSLRETDGIIVERATKTVTVNYNDAGSISASVEDAVAAGDDLTRAEAPNDADDAYEYKQAATVNADAKILVKVSLAADKKNPITSVTYQIGEGSAQEAEFKNGSYEFEAKASEDITVNVAKSADKKLVVEVNGVAKEADEDGVYNVSYTDEITAKVFNGESALTLFNAVVKDGAKNAATVATLNAEKNGATITVDKREYNKELTVTLTTLADRTPVTFKIKSETPVDKITYGSEIAEGKLSLPVDTQVTTKVTMEAGNASYENLDAKIVSKTAKDAKAASLTNTGVDVALNGDELVITAEPSDAKGKGKADAARIVLYDRNDKDCKIIEGSEIMVSTEDATILGKAATVEAGTSTAKSLRVKITSPEGIREDLVSGASIWYKIDVTAPKSFAGVDADVKTAVTEALKVLRKYYSKEEVDADGGVSLQVVADQIVKSGKMVAIAGAQLQGFGVKVTPVQTLSNVYGDPDYIVDAQTVKGTAVDITADTQKPYYENTQAGKLKLATLNKATVITGNPARVAVAAPQFDKNASYTMVEASFVDMKTGLRRDPEGLDIKYNESTNSVEVWGNDSYSYYDSGYEANFGGEYKDLGVKVTALTEDTGYGIFGTLKLNVVNGIEEIDASAQPSVKKDANKAASFKVAVDLNESSNNTGANANFNGKYAPKAKTVTYELVGTDTNGSYDKTAAPAGIAANVTINQKNGTVTVAKGFVVDRKTPANNKFRVLVKAADYTGNTEEDLTGTITISDQSMPMGSLVIMKPGKLQNGGSDWTKATIATGVAGGKVEVTKADAAEYRAVVLQPGVGTDRDSYNLTDEEKTIVRFDAFDFAPAKGGVTVNKNGYIYVTKLGKANISATDKSDKKNKQELKAVEFVQKNTDMILELTQISDSTLEGVSHNKKFYDTNVEFSGNNTTLFGLRVVEKDEKGNVNEIQLSDVKLGFKKNVKNITPKKAADWYKYGVSKNDCQYLIATTGNPGTVTFQRKGQQAVTYTLTNTTFASGKAPKVAPVDKKVKVMEKTRTDLTYELKSAVKGESFDGKYVMLSIDNTKANPDDIRKWWDGSEWQNGAFGSYLDRAIAIRDGSLFDFSITPDYAKAYNLNVAVGSLKDGVFTQEYADAKQAVKVAKKGAVNLTVGGSYTIDPQVASMVRIQYKSTETPWFANPGVDGNWAQNAIIDNKENRFRDYFVATYDNDGEPVIGLKDDITAKELAEITADPKNPDLTGFISMENSGKRVDVKVTMKFKSVKSLKAVGTSVLSGSDMTLDIKLYNGKEYVAVKDYTIVDGAGFTKAADKKDFLTNHIMVWNEKTKKEEIGGGDIRLNGSNIPAGKVTVKLMVTPLNTPALYRDDAKQAGAVPVEAKITIAKSDLKNKVVFAKGANAWTVLSSDYVGPANIKVEKGEEVPAQGIWTKALPYTFKNALSVKEGTPIKVTADEKAPYVTFKSDAYSVANANQTLTAIIDKEKLAACVDGKKLKWGGKVTVTATFAYGDEKNPTTLKEDTAKITITLPKDIRTEALKADFEAVENDIRNMVETQTRHNEGIYNRESSEWNEDDKKDFVAWSNEDILEHVESWILDVAGSATVNVTVTPNGDVKTFKFSDEYKVVVTDAAKKEIYNHTFVVNSEETVSTVISAISAKSESNWSAVKNAMKADGTTADEDMRKLFTLTKDTTVDGYAAMIRNILTKSGDITNNIAISVELAKDGFLAPKVGTAGRYHVYVYATDKNKAPSDEGYRGSKYVMYTFDQMEAVGDAKTRVAADLADADNVKSIVGSAWKSVGKPDMTYEDESFLAAVRQNILAKANELIEKVDGKTGNDSLSATRIEDGTLELTIATGNVTKLAYQLVLTDATPDAKNSTLTINVNFTTSTPVDELQTEDALKDLITVEKLTIKSAATSEAAFGAVKEKILALSKNPAFDAAKLEVTQPANTADQKFVKPEGKTNGLVNVSVKFPSGATVTYKNIVILASGEDFVGETDDEKLLARVSGMVQAELTQAKLEDMVLGMHKKYAADTATNATSKVTEDNVKTEIARIVGGDDGEGGILAGTGYQLAESTLADNIDLGEAEITAPGSATAKMQIPTFKVKIKKGASGDAQEVTIAKKTLKAMPEFQNLEAAKSAVPLTMILNAIEGVTATMDSSEPPKMTGLSDEAKFKAAVKAHFESKITNPLFEVETAKITRSSNAEDDTSYTAPATGKYAYVVKNWKVTITEKGNDDTDTNNKEKVITTISVLKDEETKAAKAIKFTELDEKAIEDGKGGSDDPAAPENKIDGTKTEVSIAAEVEVTAGAEDNSDDFQTMTWKVTKTDDTPVAGVSIDENGTLAVDENVAVGDDHTLTVKVTATAEQKDARGKEVKGELYVKLTFEPQVSGMEVTGPETIELASDGASNEVTGYKATMEGMYLTAADRKKVTWTITDSANKPLADNVAKAEAESDADKSKGKVKIVDGSDLTEGGVIVKATVDNTGSWLDAEEPASATLAVALSKNAAADAEDAPAINLGATAGVTSEGTLADETTKKVVVTGGEVRIPLSVEGQESRTWTYTLADVSGSDLLTKYGASGSVAQNAIKVEYSSNNKRAWLVIGNNVLYTDAPDEVVPEEDDEETTPVSAKQLKLSAVTEGATGAEATMNAKALTFALVVEKSVDSAKLYEKKAADGTALDGTPDTVGAGTIEKDKSDSELKVFLRAGLEGNHIPDAEADKATYKITNKTRGLNATVTKADGDKAATVTIPANGVGFVEVTTTYKEGTGESATVKTAKRLIRIIDRSVATSIGIDGAGDAGRIEIGNDYDADANFTRTYQVKRGGTAISGVEWSADMNDAISDFISIGKTTGVLSINADPKATPYLPAGTYTVTLEASYEEEGIPYVRTQGVSIAVKKVAKEINVTAATGTDGLIKTEMADGTGDDAGKKVIVLTNGKAGTLTISAELLGDRFETADAGKLQYKVTDSDSGISDVATEATDVKNGSVQITIPDNLAATKSFTVTFSVKEGGDLVDGAEAVTADVVVSVAEAESAGG